MIITLNKKEYSVNENEFNKIPNEVYSNLLIRDDVSLCERIISLMNELSLTLNVSHGLFFNPSHGGFVPINCSSQFENIYINYNLSNSYDNHFKNITDNINRHKLTNILFLNDKHNLKLEHSLQNNLIIYSDKFENIDKDIISNFNPILLTTLSLHLLNKNVVCK